MAKDEDECTYQVWFDRSTLDEIKRLLDPEFLSRAKCRVIKHPDCCVLCAMNNDCTRVPVHWNCFIGSTRVASPVMPTDVAVRVALPDSLGGVRREMGGGLATATTVTATERDFGRLNLRAVMVREYIGDVVTIRTASGQELTGTPNHPIATRAGWVPLAELQVGDHVLRSTQSEWVDLVDPDVDDIPPTIEDVAKTFPVRLNPVPTAAQDFHSDGAGSEVHVVLTDGLLVNDVASMCAEHLAKLEFGSRTVTGTFEFTSSRADFERFVAPLLPPNCVVRCAGEAGPLGGGGLGHANKHGAAAVAHGRVSLAEPTRDEWTADSEGFCERLDAFALDVEADEIVDVDRRVFLGHVYNLETQAGWYLADSIVVHNCRCKAEMYLELEMQ